MLDDPKLPEVGLLFAFGSGDTLHQAAGTCRVSRADGGQVSFIDEKGWAYLVPLSYFRRHAIEVTKREAP